MGDTISFSSGKVPEGPSLVREARAWVETINSKPTEEWIRGYVLDGINYVESLCDVLEEREREEKTSCEGWPNFWPSVRAAHQAKPSEAEEELEHKPSDSETE